MKGNNRCAHKHGTLLNSEGVHFTLTTAIASVPENFVLFRDICDSIEAPDKARRSIFTQSIVDSFLDATWQPQYKDVQLDTAPWWMTPKPLFGLFV